MSRTVRSFQKKIVLPPSMMMTPSKNATAIFYSLGASENLQNNAENSIIVETGKFNIGGRKPDTHSTSGPSSGTWLYVSKSGDGSSTSRLSLLHPHTPQGTSHPRKEAGAAPAHCSAISAIRCAQPLHCQHVGR